MFQRAQLRSRDTSVRAREVAVEHTMAPVGKHALAQDLAPHLGPDCAYERAIATAQRTVEAIRYTAIPALVAAMRRKEMAPLAKEMAITQAAIEVRHMLLVANQHVCALEKSASYTDPIVQFLRRDITFLTTRASMLGAYKGFEQLKPQGHIEPIKPKETHIKKSMKTAHKHMPAKNPFAAAQPASITRAKRKGSLESRKPLPRMNRMEAR